MFAIRLPGPWRQTRHFEVTFAQLPADEGVLKSLKPPVLNAQSGDGFEGRLGCPRDHFLSSTDWHHRP
jgi:hypothetical protein